LLGLVCVDRGESEEPVGEGRGLVRINFSGGGSSVVTCVEAEGRKKKRGGCLNLSIKTGSERKFELFFHEKGGGGKAGRGYEFDGKKKEGESAL